MDVIKTQFAMAIWHNLRIFFPQKMHLIKSVKNLKLKTFLQAKAHLTVK